jgi:hypothetical protein
VTMRTGQIAEFAHVNLQHFRSGVTQNQPMPNKSL